MPKSKWKVYTYSRQPNSSLVYYDNNWPGLSLCFILLTSDPYLFHPKSGNAENNTAAAQIVITIAFAYNRN